MDSAAADARTTASVMTSRSWALRLGYMEPDWDPASMASVPMNGEAATWLDGVATATDVVSLEDSGVRS
jgi:hypothetical protein